MRNGFDPIHKIREFKLSISDQCNLIYFPSMEMSSGVLFCQNMISLLNLMLNISMLQKDWSPDWNISCFGEKIYALLSDNKIDFN